MAGGLARGDIWLLYRPAPDKRRPDLANIFTARQDELRQFVGTVGPDKMRAICRALLLATGCD